jgi:hypothetical protein
MEGLIYFLWGFVPALAAGLLVTAICSALWRQE